MSRHFRPVGGFADRSISLVKIDDEGRSHYVMADGSELVAQYVTDKTRIAMPTWSLAELENMTRGGKWEEVEAPPVVPQNVQHRELPNFIEPVHTQE